MTNTPNTSLAPTPVTPVSFRCGFRVGGSHRLRGCAHLSAAMRIATLSILLAVASGCGTRKEEIGAAIAYSPLIVTGLPVYALAQGWRALRDTGADRIYPPTGLTQAQVENQIERLPGDKPKKEINFNSSQHTESWVVRKGRAIVYARFQNGLTIEYEK